MGAMAITVSAGRDGYGRDETIATAGQGLDEARAIGGVAQCVAKALDGGVETVVEIDKGVGGPESGAELLACDELTRILQQDRQDLEGLILKLDLLAVFAQFGGGKISLKNAKADGAVVLCLGHRILSD